MAGFLAPFVNVAWQVAENTVMNKCTFENDTKYKVIIVDHDGTRDLDPGRSQGNYLVTGFSVDLIMQFSDTEEAKINFPSSQYENRTHKIGRLFAEEIKKFEGGQSQSAATVLSSSSKWHLAYGHPGGFVEKVTTKMVAKNSWQEMQERGYEAEGKVGGMIKAVELSASFKATTKMTHVNQYEQEITSSRERTFNEPCYLWQEIVVIKTDQAAPFDSLEIPTNNTKTTTAAEIKPGKDKFRFSK